MRKEKVNKLWMLLPFYYFLEIDTDFDDAYLFKGASLLLSIIFLSITLPFYTIGKLLAKTK